LQRFVMGRGPSAFGAPIQFLYWTLANNKTIDFGRLRVTTSAGKKALPRNPVFAVETFLELDERPRSGCLCAGPTAIKAKVSDCQKAKTTSYVESAVRSGTDGVEFLSAGCGAQVFRLICFCFFFLLTLGSRVANGRLSRSTGLAWAAAPPDYGCALTV